MLLHSEVLMMRQSWPVGQHPTAVFPRTAIHSVPVGQQKLEMLGFVHRWLPAPQLSFEACRENKANSGYNCFDVGEADTKGQIWRSVVKTMNIVVDLAMLYFMSCEARWLDSNYGIGIRRH